MSSQLGNSHEFIAFLEEDLMLSEPEAPSTAMDVSMNMADVTMLTVMDADFDDLPFPSQIPVTDGEAEVEVDEFDDFEEADLIEHDLMDEECDELFEFELDMTLTQLPITAIEQVDSLDDFSAQQAPQFTSFTTGKGRALPPPSEESIKRAKRLVEEEVEEKSIIEEVPIVVGFSTGKGRALPPPSKEALERAQAVIGSEDKNPTVSTSSFGGFSTGKGKSLPPPSREALEKAQSLMGADEKSITPTTGFSSGKGKALLPPSKEVLERAQTHIGNENDTVPSSATNSAASFGGFSTGKGKAMPPPSKEALERAQGIISSRAFNEEPPITTNQMPSFSIGKGKVMPPPSKEALQRAQSLVNSSNETNENLPPKQPTAIAFQSSVPPKRRAWKQPRQILTKAPTEVNKKLPPVSLFELKSTQTRLKLAKYFTPSPSPAHSSEVYSQFGM